MTPPKSISIWRRVLPAAVISAVTRLILGNVLNDLIVEFCSWFVLLFILFWPVPVSNSVAHEPGGAPRAFARVAAAAAVGALAGLATVSVLKALWL